MVIHATDGTSSSVRTAVTQVRPNVTFHLATHYRAEHNEGDIESMLSANIVFGTVLVDALSTIGDSTLIAAGSTWQHHDGRDVPANLYAATKSAFEAILSYYADLSRVRIMSLLLSDTYGPDDHRTKLFTILSDAAASRETLRMSAGEQLIDYVFIDDVIGALLASVHLAATTTGLRRYVIRSGDPRSLREIVRLWCELSGLQLDVEWAARPYGSRQTMRPWEGGAMLPGWTPKVMLESGIALTLGTGKQAHESRGSQGRDRRT